jgi:hypothetical protein
VGPNLYHVGGVPNWSYTFSIFQVYHFVQIKYVNKFDFMLRGTKINLTGTLQLGTTGQDTVATLNNINAIPFLAIQL